MGNSPKKSNKIRFFEFSTILNIIILLAFTAFFIYKQNYEFISYTLVLGLVILLLAWSNKKYHYFTLAKYGFSLWLFGHLAGGSFKIAGTRLYDLILLPLIEDPYNILRYDQLVHFFCYLIITAFIYSIVKYYFRDKENKVPIAFIAVLAGTGIGGINEIIEFATVAFFGATGVGNYTNNALDLVFNLLGAIVAVLIIRKKN